MYFQQAAHNIVIIIVIQKGIILTTKVLFKNFIFLSALVNNNI